MPARIAHSWSLPTSSHRGNFSFQAFDHGDKHADQLVCFLHPDLGQLLAQPAPSAPVPPFALACLPAGHMHMVVEVFRGSSPVSLLKVRRDRTSSPDQLASNLAASRITHQPIGVPAGFLEEYHCPDICRVLCKRVPGEPQSNRFFKLALVHSPPRYPSCTYPFPSFASRLSPLVFRLSSLA